MVTPGTWHRLPVTPLTLLVDADPSLETLGLDVDDDLALLFLLGSPEVALHGVTTVFGNSWGRLTHLSARGTLRHSGRGELPVVRGAGGPRDTAGAKRAGVFLAAALRERPGATLLALGPLTNVAAAALEPGFEGDLGALVVMGGRAEGGLSDFNVRKDPAAASRVLALGCPKTLVTLDVGLGIAVTPDDVDALCADPASAVSQHRAKLGRFARLQSAWRAARGRSRGEVTGGFHPWDILAAAAVTNPGLFGLVSESISFDARGRTQKGGRDGAAVLTTASVDAEGFRALFFERVAAPRLRT